MRCQICPNRISSVTAFEKTSRVHSSHMFWLALVLQNYHLTNSGGHFFSATLEMCRLHYRQSCRHPIHPHHRNPPTDPHRAAPPTASFRTALLLLPLCCFFPSSSLSGSLTLSLTRGEHIDSQSTLAKWKRAAHLCLRWAERAYNQAEHQVAKAAERWEFSLSVITLGDNAVASLRKLKSKYNWDAYLSQLCVYRPSECYEYISTGKQISIFSSFSFRDGYLIHLHVYCLNLSQSNVSLNTRSLPILHHYLDNDIRWRYLHLHLAFKSN